MALWPAKKDQKEDHVQIEIPDLPGATGVTPVPRAGDDAGAIGVTPVSPAGEAPDQLGQLCARLGQLGDLLSHANQQVLAYLVDQRSKAFAPLANHPSGATLAQKLDSLTEKLAQIEAKLERLADRLAPEEPDQPAEPAGAMVGLPNLAAGTAGQAGHRPEVGRGTRPVCGPVIGPPGATGVTPVPLAGDDWQRAL